MHYYCLTTLGKSARNYIMQQKKKFEKEIKKEENYLKKMPPQMNNTFVEIKNEENKKKSFGEVKYHLASENKIYFDIFPVILKNLLSYEKQIGRRKSKRTNKNGTPSKFSITKKAENVRSVIIKMILYRKDELSQLNHVKHFFLSEEHRVTNLNPVTGKKDYTNRTNNRLYTDFLRGCKKQISLDIKEITGKIKRSELSFDQYSEDTKNYELDNDCTIKILEYLSRVSKASFDNITFLFRDNIVLPFQVNNCLECLDAFGFISVQKNAKLPPFLPEKNPYSILTRGRVKLYEYKENKKNLARRRFKERFSPLFWYNSKLASEYALKNQKWSEITVLVDHREFGFNSNYWNSYVARLFRVFKLDYQLRSLAVADYAFQITLNGEDYYYPLLIERKTMLDLADSSTASPNDQNANTRLSRQLCNMILLQKEIPRLKLEFLFERLICNQEEAIENLGSSRERILTIQKLLEEKGIRVSLCNDELQIIRYLKNLVENFKAYGLKGLIKKEEFDAALTRVKEKRRKMKELKDSKEYIDRTFGGKHLFVSQMTWEEENLFEGTDENIGGEDEMSDDEIMDEDDEDTDDLLMDSKSSETQMEIDPKKEENPLPKMEEKKEEKKVNVPLCIELSDSDDDDDIEIISVEKPKKKEKAPKKNEKNEVLELLDTQEMEETFQKKEEKAEKEEEDYSVDDFLFDDDAETQDPMNVDYSVLKDEEDRIKAEEKHLPSKDEEKMKDEDEDLEDYDEEATQDPNFDFDQSTQEMDPEYNYNADTQSLEEDNAMEIETEKEKRAKAELLSRKD